MQGRSSTGNMTKSINILSARALRTLGPGGHSDGGNLYFVVEPSGARRWSFIYQRDGRRREMGLGGFNSVSLAEARQAATAARSLLAKGIDPISERRLQRAKGVTFGIYGPALFKALKPQWKNAKHVYQWERSIEVHAQPLHGLAIEKITTADVLKVLQPLWLTVPETAERTRQRIHKVLDAAEGEGLRSGPNPARWEGCLEHLLPKRRKLSHGHHPAMPFDEVNAFMTDLIKRPALAARALEFTVLTAARTGEVLGARWAEIDLEAAVWTVPADRMKGGVEHRVPLSTQALAVLGRVSFMPAPDDFVFGDPEDGRPLSNMAMRALMKRMKFERFAVHGFRSTFRDWSGELTDFAWDVIETALAHKVGTDVHRAYRRGDALEKRRELMETWGGFCVDPLVLAVAA